MKNYIIIHINSFSYTLKIFNIPMHAEYAWLYGDLSISIRAMSHESHWSIFEGGLSVLCGIATQYQGKWSVE